MQNNYPTKTATLVGNYLFDLVHIVQESIETTNFSVNQNMHFYTNQLHHSRIQDMWFENKEDSQQKAPQHMNKPSFIVSYET